VKERKIECETLEGTKDAPIYVLSEGKERVGWGLWIRTIGKWFYFCDECEKAIDELFEESETFDVDLSGVKLGLDFSAKKEERGGHLLTIPMLDIALELCDKCAKGIRKLILESDSIILGNKDYMPGIELQKKSGIVDGAWKVKVRRPATKKEIEKLGGTVADIRE